MKEYSPESSQGREVQMRMTGDSHMIETYRQLYESVALFRSTHSEEEVLEGVRVLLYMADRDHPNYGKVAGDATHMLVLVLTLMNILSKAGQVH